jgi:hypothetical protein
LIRGKDTLNKTTVNGGTKIIYIYIEREREQLDFAVAHRNIEDFCICN